MMKLTMRAAEGARLWWSGSRASRLCPPSPAELKSFWEMFPQSRAARRTAGATGEQHHLIPRHQTRGVPVTRGIKPTGEPNPRRTPVGLSSVHCLSKGMWWWCCADFDVQLCAAAAAAAAEAWCTVTIRPAAAGFKRATTAVFSLKNGTLIKNINKNKKRFTPLAQYLCLYCFILNHIITAPLVAGSN